MADNYAGLIEEVHQVNRHNPVPLPALNPVVARVNDVGRSAVGATEDLSVFLQMLGSLFLALVGVLRRPRSLRLTSLVYQLYRVGFQAIPIIVLITFLIGAIIAQQGFFHFRKFGADSYVVDMVGILVLRELGVLIVAIMVAGRSGSAYTAELGSMKMREEIDALSTMGLDPVEVLILPRIIALVCALPILSFIGSMAALYGGGLVAQFYGGMGPAIFIARLHDAVSVTHFEVGIIKAPFMALVIGIVACSEGLAGEGKRRVARQADDDLGGEIDLSGDRARRAVCDLLRIDRNVSDARSDTAVRDPRPRSCGRLRPAGRDRPSVAGCPQGRDPRPGRRFRRRQVGLDADHHRAHSAAKRGDRGHGRRDRRQPGSQHPERRRPMGYPVPAGRAVFVAHRAAEYPVSACAKISCCRRR